MAKRVRLVDIAERLNLTKVSVSKALRDHPDISKRTRNLVKKVADEMGYSPNLVARSLSSQRSHTLGVVVPKIAHTFFAAIIDAIQEEATQAGYGILLAVSNENAGLERQHIERLLAMRVDGLLVSVTQQRPDVEVYERVREMQVPLVFFDRAIETLDFTSVTVDDRAGARRAVEHMIGEGYRRIAHVAGTPDVSIGRERQAGYVEAMEAHGIPVREGWLRPGGFDERHGYQAFREILESGDVPDVVFAVTLPVCLGVYGAIRDHDPELLDRIHVISFSEADSSEFHLFPHTNHTCVRQPAREMGRLALELLLEAVESDEPVAVQRLVLQTELVTPEKARAISRRAFLPRRASAG